MFKICLCILFLQWKRKIGLDTDTKYLLIVYFDFLLIQINTSSRYLKYFGYFYSLNSYSCQDRKLFTAWNNYRTLFANDDANNCRGNSFTLERVFDSKNNGCIGWEYELDGSIFVMNNVFIFIASVVQCPAVGSLI